MCRRAGVVQNQLVEFSRFELELRWKEAQSIVLVSKLNLDLHGVLFRHVAGCDRGTAPTKARYHRKRQTKIRHVHLAILQSCLT